MKGLLPKVLYPLAGKPMIKYLIESILSSKKSFKLDKLIIVTGYKADLVEKVVGNYNGEVKFVRQKQQTGTANAVLSVVKEFNNKYDNNLVILSGDAPLINIPKIMKTKCFKKK